ncbi:MAG: acetate--CoA ligase family protein [Hyphomicrobiaceae bacterium]
MPDIRALLWPNAVAVVGATNDQSKLRGRTFSVMRGHPFAGPVYPIARREAEVAGLKAYPAIADVPQQVDLAVLIIPAEHVPAELERCGKAGVKAAHIITSGFAEETGERGRELQAELRRVQERYDMAVCGPNSQGFVNTRTALCPTFSPSMALRERPLISTTREGGRIAVLAQSGGVGFAFFDRGDAKGLPFSYVVTTGNEACLESFDIVDFMLDEGETDVFILFVESIKNPETFRRVADKAARAGKPIIFTKIGQSDAGRRSAASHTGSLAGSYSAYRAMFDHYGLIEGRDMDEMIDIAAAFSCNMRRLPKGRRVCIVSGSGGGAGWIADACAGAGLEVPELDRPTRDVIDAYLPAYGTSQNPVDGTAQAIRTLGYARLAELASRSPIIDGVVVVTTARSAHSYEPEKELLFEVARECPKPLVMWTYTLPVASSIALLSDAGYPLYTDLQNCARAMAAMADYGAFLERYRSGDGPSPVAEAARAAARAELSAAGPLLSEVTARRVLTHYGIGGREGGVLVTTPEAAVAEARGLGGPVVLKVQSPDILHKTEAGGVAVGLEGDDAVAAAYARILASAQRHAPAARIEGVLVQPMAAAGLEMIVGVSRDELFGPLLMVGLGGIHVEVLKDVAFAPVPLTPAAAERLVRVLRAAPLLDGVRGAPAADVPAVVDILVRLSHFAADNADLVSEIDLNPVRVHASGHGATVLDALIAKR